MIKISKILLIFVLLTLSSEVVVIQYAVEKKNHVAYSKITPGINWAENEEAKYNIFIGIKTGLTCTTCHHNIYIGTRIEGNPNESYMLRVGSYSRGLKGPGIERKMTDEEWSALYHGMYNYFNPYAKCSEVK